MLMITLNPGSKVFWLYFSLYLKEAYLWKVDVELREDGYRSLVQIYD